MRHKWIIFLCLIGGLITFSNLFWISQNTITPYYDTAGHTNLSYIYANILKGELPLGSPADFLKVSTYYPPLMFILGGIWTTIFGFYYQNLQVLALIISLLTSFGVYLYSKNLTGSSKLAFYSASFYTLLPVIWEQSRYFMLDIPLTGLLMISLYFLQKKNIALFFLFGSLAQLTKWYAGIYLIIPFLYYYYHEFRNKNLLKSLIVPIIFSLIVVLPWYLINIKDFLLQAGQFYKPDYGDPLNILSLANLSFYSITIAKYQIISVFLLWLILSTILLIKFKPQSYKLVLFQIAFIYIIFTLIGNKNQRYLIPLLPFLTIIMAYGASKIKIIPSLLLGLGVIIYTINSFGFPIKGDFLLSSENIQYAYKKTYWSQKTIISDLALMSGKDPKTTLVVANNPEVSVASLYIFSLENNRNLFFKEVPFDKNENLTDFSEFDYILVPKEFVGPLDQPNLNNMNAIRLYLLSGKERDLTIVKTYLLPSGDSLYLLKNDPYRNMLGITLRGDNLTIIKPKLTAPIFIQFMDENLNWKQESISEDQTEVSKNISGIKRIRIDYPANLLRIDLDGSWRYDNERQFDRINSEQKK